MQLALPCLSAVGARAAVVVSAFALSNYTGGSCSQTCIQSLSQVLQFYAWVLLHKEVQLPIRGDLDFNAEKYLMLLSGGVAG